MDMALALVAQQAGGDTYMTANAYTYRVLVARDGDEPLELPAAMIERAVTGSRVRFARDVPAEREGRVDLSQMLIQAPMARVDGGFDVAFSYSTCLRSGGFYAWDSLAEMRKAGSQWRVVSVTWIGHSRGKCDARERERPA